VGAASRRDINAMRRSCRGETPLSQRLIPLFYCGSWKSLNNWNDSHSPTIAAHNGNLWVDLTQRLDYMIIGFKVRAKPT
jgi:hypothetical protein